MHIGEGRGSGTRHRQRAPIGHADILARTNDHPPRYICGVFACLEHAREPVQRRVGLAPAHALVHRGDEVVVRIALPVKRRRHGAAQRVE